jgi:hypothetical protein
MTLLHRFIRPGIHKRLDLVRGAERSFRQNISERVCGYVIVSFLRCGWELSEKQKMFMTVLGESKLYGAAQSLGWTPRPPPPAKYITLFRIFRIGSRCFPVYLTETLQAPGNRTIFCPMTNLSMKVTHFHSADKSVAHAYEFTVRSVILCKLNSYWLQWCIYYRLPFLYCTIAY